MELFFHLTESGWDFIVASIPYIMAYILLKKLKIKPTIVMQLMIFILVIYVYFWIKLKDMQIICYQAIAYVLAFVWVWAQYLLQKKDYNND